MYFSDEPPFFSFSDNFEIQYSYFQPQKKPNLMNLVLLPMLLPAIFSSKMVLK